MKHAILAALLLAGCASQPDGSLALTPQAAKALADLCVRDAQLQPVAITTVQGAAVLAPVAGPAGVTTSAVLATGAALDASLLHPAVVNACATLPTLPVAAPKAP